MSEPLQLVSRRHCHLCDLVRPGLSRWAALQGHALHELDVDGDPDLLARYGDRVPVLLLGDRVIGEGRFQVAAAIRAAEAAISTALTVR